MRMDAYIRVSRVGGRSGDSFLSPDLQREQIQGYARLHGHEVAAEHVDLDQSGGTINRPGFQAALARIEAGQSEGVIVAKLDRFARSVPRAHEAIERIQAAGGSFVSVAEQIDLATSTGRLMFNMLASIAEWERERNIESWEASNASAIGRGIHFTAQVPFGYVRGEDRRLVPDADTAPLVREAFRRRAQRESWSGIAAWLNDVHPREDGRSWSSRFVATMIQRRTYLGIAHHGKHELEDAHDPLVTLPEWTAANAVTGGPGPVHENGALLAGVIRCAGCRYAMRRTFVTYRDGRRVEQYACQVKHTGGRCPAPAHVMAHVIEPVVSEWVLTWVGHARRVEGQEGDELEQAQRSYADAEARLGAFLADDELAEAVGRTAHLQEGQRRREVVERAAERLAEAEREHAVREHGRIHFLADEWETWEKAKRADTLRRMLDSVYVRKGRSPMAERLVFRWADEDEFERPRRGTTSYRVEPIPWPESPVLDSIPATLRDDPEDNFGALLLGQALAGGGVPLPELPELTDADAA